MARRILGNPLLIPTVGILLITGLTVGLYLWPDLRPATQWEKDFRAATAGTTRIRVRTHGTGGLEGEIPEKLFEETDPDRVHEVIAGIRAASTGGSCLCFGWPSVEFYKGDEPPLTLSVHHGENLRWPGHEGGDARMSPRTARRVNAWLAEGSDWYWAQEDTGVTADTGDET